MTKHNPHACTALDAPFPVHGGHYISTGRDLRRVEPQAEPAPAAEPAATTESDTAARRGSKKREE